LTLISFYYTIYFVQQDVCVSLIRWPSAFGHFIWWESKRETLTMHTPNVHTFNWIKYVLKESLPWTGFKPTSPLHYFTLKYFHAAFCGFLYAPWHCVLIVQWLPFHSTLARRDFCWSPLFLEGKFLSSFLNLSWCVCLPYLEIMVYWLVYHNGKDTKKSWIALSNDPVFNKYIYIYTHLVGYLSSHIQRVLVE